MNRFLIINIVLSIFVISGYTGYSQNNVNQEVKVVKAYVPVVGDVHRISELPKIVDTNKVITKFEYEILPARHTTSFTPTEIKPARLISEPLSKLYYGYGKLGFGSYLSPLAQVHFGSKRSKQWNWNTLFSHNSSHGKIKNEVGDKVYAGVSNTILNAQTSYFAKKHKVFSLDAKFSNDINYYYGFNPEKALPSPPLLKDSIENQVVNFFKISGNMRSNYLDSSNINYNINLGWQTLSAKQNISENALNIDASLNYFFEKEYVGADLSLDYYKHQGITDSLNGAIVRFSPWIGAFGDKWRVVVGVNTFYDQSKLDYFFSPRVSMHYNVIDYFLIPYLELDGNYDVNSYKDIYDQNPFIVQNLGVTPTETKISMTLGIRGNISSKIAFNAKVNYSKINNQYFFVNDTSLTLQNKFDVVYDNLDKIRILGELSYNTGENLFLSLSGNYYSYNLEIEKHAWHMPNYKVSLNARYIVQNKIILTSNIFALGSRYVREFDKNNNLLDKELSGIIDLNLGMEYRLSKIFSAFINLNNIAAVKYYEWNHYPSQQFNMMMGITYSF
jgi:hypothetical protein